MRLKWWRSLRDVLAVAVLLVAVSAAGLVGLYLLPAALVPANVKLSAVDRLHAESEQRNSIAQFLAGTAVLAGLYFTARTLRLNASAARQNHEAQLRALELTERGQITDRFTKAVEQVADDKLDVRLGGIYALERIAVDAESYYEPIMEILTTFLRENSTGVGASGSRRPPPDLLAVARVLGRRPAHYWLHGRELDLAGVDLANANLWNAHLERAVLRNARLDGTFLDGAFLQHADLTEASLRGAHLCGTHLGGAKFYRARLDGADLRFTDLSETEGLEPDQLGTAIMNDGTRLPPSLVAKPQP
jgi:uncharacterized protein YjbI with pentapeptide repeats